jgi:hypothetical protein
MDIVQPIEDMDEDEMMEEITAMERRKTALTVALGREHGLARIMRLWSVRVKSLALYSLVCGRELSCLSCSDTPMKNALSFGTTGLMLDCDLVHWVISTVGKCSKIHLLSHVFNRLQSWVLLVVDISGFIIR